MGENNNETSKLSRWAEGLQAEWHKIVWPEKKSLGRQTTAVIIVSIILGAIIAVLDLGIQHGVDFLVNL